MIKYVNIAKGKHVFIKKVSEPVDDLEFGNEVEVDRIKYLVGTITSMGHEVNEDYYAVGMLVKCAAFVAVDFGDGEYGLDSEDIIGETREVQINE